jgi:hypothetical protein
MSRSFGKNVALNQKLAQALPGFSGDFGGGRLQAYLEGAGRDAQIAADAVLQAEGFGDYSYGTNVGYSPAATASPAPAQITELQGDVGGIQTDVTGLTAGQAGLMTGQQNLQTGVTGLTGDVGALQTDVTNLTGDVGTVQEGVTGLGTAIGQPVGEQTDLFAGQRGLMSEVGDVGTQVEGVGTQVGDVQTGVTGLEQAVGAPAEGDPRTLFAGQQTLLGGQDRLGQEIGGGVDRLTGEITNVGADLTALQRASDAYQREAQRQRTLAAQAGQTGREQLERQVAGVGQQANRLAEAQAAQRLAATPRGMMQMGTGVAPTAGPQIAAQTAQAAQQGFRPPAQGVPAPVSPLGPQAQDPRDLLTQLQQLQAQQAGLMAQLGI